MKRPPASRLTPQRFQSLLLQWFDLHGRKLLPWQQQKTPYRVWVSEIMLQQTQVSTVIPYYTRFMQTFPDVNALANAHEDEVMHLWTGLGYYTRARNLHAAAKKIVTQLAGKFPDNLADLTALPGIGTSTAGAILAIAFNQRAAILDGNVKRVLSRIEGIEDPIDEKAVEQTLWQLADHFTPQERVADYTQAIMDLGATLCTRSKPNCGACPFRKNCRAHELGLEANIPRKKSTKTIPTREATFLILCHEENILLEKQPAKGIWGGLWCFPMLTGKQSKRAVTDYCKSLPFTISDYTTLDTFRHTFSHYHLLIHPVIIQLKTAARIKVAESLSSAPQIWYNLAKPTSIGLPRPVQALLETFT